MSEEKILEAIKEHIRKQGSKWRFVRGRDVLNREAMIEKLDKDPSFRSHIVEMVVAQTIEILGG